MHNIKPLYNPSRVPSSHPGARKLVQAKGAILVGTMESQLTTEQQFWNAEVERRKTEKKKDSITSQDEYEKYHPKELCAE